MSSSELENKFLNESIDEETLERIRNIRSSERSFYQKITDVYSSCSIDYEIGDMNDLKSFIYDTSIDGINL